MKITKYYLDKELKFILYNVHEIKLKYSIFRQLYLDEKFTNINLRLRSIAVIFSELLLYIMKWWRLTPPFNYYSE